MISDYARANVYCLAIIALLFVCYFNLSDHLQLVGASNFGNLLSADALCTEKNLKLMVFPTNIAADLSHRSFRLLY